MAVTGSVEKAEKMSPYLKGWLKGIGLYSVPSEPSPITLKTPPLYRKTSAGFDISYYKVKVLDSKDIAINRVISPEGSTKVKEYRSTVRSKPAITPDEHIKRILTKKVIKNLREGWCETKELASVTTKETLKKPMKLHKWEKFNHKIKPPYLVQPKINGVYCDWDAEKKKLFSRSGKEIDLPHIRSILDFDNVTEDLAGEIAYEDHTIMLPEVIHGISVKDSKLMFHVFDVPCKESFGHRFIGNLNKLMRINGSIIRILQTRILTSKEMVAEYYKECVMLGMEGIVVRSPDSPFEYGKRSMYTLKYKEEFEEYYKIKTVVIDSHPGGPLAKFVMKTTKGLYFHVVPAWSHKDRRDALKVDQSKFVGKQMLVEYRGVSEDGIPIHAVGKTSLNGLIESRPMPIVPPREIIWRG